MAAISRPNQQMGGSMRSITAFCALAFMCVSQTGCAPPPVRGGFLASTVEDVKIVIPIGETRTVELGETMYEQGVKTTSKSRTAKLLAPVVAELELGHRLNLPAGAGGVLQTRSAGRELALCFPTTGAGTAVQAITLSGTVIACLVDVDRDGTFDQAMFATREKYFPLAAKVPYSMTESENVTESKGAFRADFIYQGYARGVLRFSYREFRDGLARPAFTQELTYEAETDGTATIGFKGMRIKVLKATNQNVTYVIERGMNL